jgi:hypothetical protein
MNLFDSLLEILRTGKSGNIVDGGKRLKEHGIG